MYAATVKIIDDNVGQLVDELKRKGVFDNTIIMILSDNGGNVKARTVFGTYKGEKSGQINSTVFEGGIVTPHVISYPNGIIETMKGEIVHKSGHLIDIKATLK